ncbi:uncharacterized protein TNCV_2704611 [Trichonephila clavipes]|nr:uncharacterized protein TNCV_2704611 [Trichonephila clavipes]
MLAQVSSSSLDRGSKLRGPYSATLTNTHSLDLLNVPNTQWVVSGIGNRIQDSTTLATSSRLGLFGYSCHVGDKVVNSVVSGVGGIVRVHYFERGGFVRHRSRASSKHLSPHLPVDELDSSGVKKGLRCTCKLHVWVSGLQRNRPDVDVWRSDVTIGCSTPQPPVRGSNGAGQWHNGEHLGPPAKSGFGPPNGDRFNSCQVIYSQFGLAIHQNDHQARRRFVEWAYNEIAFVPDFHKQILFSDEAHFWLNGYVNKQNCRIWSEANPQVYVETPLHPEKLTVWCALWAGGILLQKR